MDIKKESVKEKLSLSLPFDDPEFVMIWNELRQQPKWEKKTEQQLQKSLNKLSKYDARFAIELMNTAIENNYQGVVFADTPEQYKKWQRQQDGDITPAPIKNAKDID